jgi:hydrogenase maturation protease
VADSILVIGFGNPLRQDDGVGQHVARMVAALKWPCVQAIAVHQLTPELAESLAAASKAVFVDAAPGTEAVRRCPILENTHANVMAHTGDATWLLGLAGSVFGKRPPAWLVTIPSHQMEYGFGLSPMAKRGAREAVAMIDELRHQSEIDAQREQRSRR